jgi:alpha-L-arabinofuranosidase
MKPLFSCLLVGLFALGSDGYTQSGNIQVTININNPAHRISPYITGLGLAYHNETDVFVKEFKAAETFRTLGIGALRYPGGHKTSSFHWEEPWYPVYTDKYDPDLSNRLQRLGLTEEQLPTVNANYMDLDEFLKLAQASGAEPLVGINIKTGQLYDREADQTAETLRMFRHIKERGYRVTWYYIDNEVGHTPHKKPMTIPEYAGYINRLVPELRKIQPNAKFIVNIMGTPFSDKNVELMRLAGKNYDAIDTHHYWNWGKASWQEYLAQRPLVKSGDTLYEMAEKFRVERDKLGLDHIRLMSLEWSAGPVAEGETLSAYQCALIESEMMGQFIQGDYRATTMWPFQWKISGRIYPGRVFVDQNGKATKPIKDVFRLYSRCRDAAYVPAISASTDIVAHAAISDAGIVYTYLLNKSPETKSITLNLGGAQSGQGTLQSLYGRDLTRDNIPVPEYSPVMMKQGTVNIMLAPWSFSLVELEIEI